ncbi:MAG: hypothetical protein ACYCOO_11000 [Chitinophagaceae bacterium]
MSYLNHFLKAERRSSKTITAIFNRQEKEHLKKRELIDQVYEFSRMYWKSIIQQNLPVTTKYPEMGAEIFLHFEHNNLPAGVWQGKFVVFVK